MPEKKWLTKMLNARCLLDSNNFNIDPINVLNNKKKLISNSDLISFDLIFNAPNVANLGF